MLTIDHLLNEFVDVPEKDRTMQVVVRDYDGNLHRLIPENIMHDYAEGLVIIDMHGEMEDE